MRLLFDLDGTITDSRLGVTRCIQYAVEDAGLVSPPLQALTRYVGPPLAGSFATLLGTDDGASIERAIQTYRERFERVGMFENRVYPGMASMLERQRNAGHQLRIVTVKPRPYATRILEHFGLLPLFSAVHGPGLDARVYSKASLIHDALSSMDGELGSTLMIGDRAEDILGARAHGIPAVAVMWGYGDAHELEAARPDYRVRSVEELESVVTLLASRS